MTFPIMIRHDGRNIRLVVEQVFLDARTERFKVQARNGFVIVESNRPLLRNKGLKHKPPIWKTIEANKLATYVLEKIYAAIEKHVDAAG
jgi:hypothetical protein